MGRADRKMAEARRGTLLPHALHYDLDVDSDYMRPGNRAAERAYQVLWCGFDLLLNVLDDGYPATDQKTQKRGRKWGRANLLFTGAEGAIMLGNALPALIFAMDGRLSDDDPGSDVPVERHAELAGLVSSFFPVRAGKKGNGYALYNLRRVMIKGSWPKEPYVDYCLAEFKVLETGQPRPEVAAGEERGSAYSEALLRGEDPSGDPALVEEQRQWARDYCINVATACAVLANTARPDQRTIGPAIVDLWKDDGPAVEEYRQRALAAWIAGSRSYNEYVALEAQGAGATAGQ